MQFLIGNKARVRVVGEDARSWRLSNGRIAKKATEGVSWIWASSPDDSETLVGLLSRLNVNQSERPFYAFGNWDYYTNDHEGQLMPGFTPDPPGAEICGTYKIVFVSALRFDNNQNKAKIFLRRQPDSQSSRLTIKEEQRMFQVGRDDRSTTGRTRRTNIRSETLYSGKVELEKEGVEIDQYFGPGYNFYGFSNDSEARQSYSPMATNSALIVTKLNDNKGRIYKIGPRKAFKLVTNEYGVVRNESILYTSQEEETQAAQRVCRCKHFSFLCTSLGLPCSAAELITSFVHQHEPYIFAEPGDLWLDIRLTTPNRTYVLARPCSSEDVESDSDSSSDGFGYVESESDQGSDDDGSSDSDSDSNQGVGRQEFDFDWLEYYRSTLHDWNPNNY